MFSPSHPTWRIGHVDSRVDQDALKKLANLMLKQGLRKVELQEHYSAVSGLRPFKGGIDIDAVSLSATGTIRDEISASRSISNAEANTFAKYTVCTYLHGVSRSTDAHCMQLVRRPSIATRWTYRERAVTNSSVV